MKNGILTALMVTPFAMASFFPALPAHTQNQIDFSGTCQNFEDIEQQTSWWLKEYGALLTAGTLFLDVSHGDDFRIGQLFLMLREISQTGVGDLQKHLTIEVELYALLGAGKSVDADTVFSMLDQSARSELATQSTDFRRLQICAFECPNGPEGSPSDEFRACIADQ
ncbi:hypothetical protein [Roseobacter sp. S98]|uniref:hypothetical protein n=1 Tax=Roseobacter algicola (ex Choi et al. 2025) (nom. illeg.) TaxID=3092138 RepID=UPI0035C681C7